MDLFEYSYTVLLPTVLQKPSMENPDTCAQRDYISPTIYPPATQPALLQSTESSEHTVLLSMSASLVGGFIHTFPNPIKKRDLSRQGFFAHVSTQG